MSWLVLIGLMIFMVSTAQLIKKIPNKPGQYDTFKAYFLNLPTDMQQSFLNSLDKNSRSLFEYYLLMAEDNLRPKPRPLFLDLRTKRNWQAERQLDLELEKEMWEQFKSWAIGKEN